MINLFRFLVLFAVLCAGSVWAQSSGLRALTDREDLLGWEAVGRLELNNQGFCTAVLISNDLVLTAAHCVVEKSGSLRPADQIRFRAGLTEHGTLIDRGVSQIVAHEGYDRNDSDRLRRVRNDVALLRLDQIVTSTEADAFAAHDGRRYDSDIFVASFARGREERLSVQRHCRLVAEQEGVLAVDCDLTFGASGAPVFSWTGNRGQVLGVVSAGSTLNGKKIGLVSKLADRLPELKAQLRRAPVVRPKGEVKRIRVGNGGGAFGTNSGGAKFLRVGD
ncbi:V8-like Glu-specific endopeptidase [Tritonibacter multivorans]|uniref:V8-like Glu-specific endopeptidase n=1 Tax=Tritonibacter multivorans TaxID=928856 RepID=A0A0P1GP06_9RHOB|nr:trypsin-like serine protease [Tritonibacter multivorans]MDA7422551.1 trypsin-like serine protease [Tritonibacter multivorans]CUH76352.1 V8-like Glu-specific endopeptidase [Tritonibacter multivorans]SFD39377.1 protease YdgD [Tritonibacter multivorans]